MRPYRTTSAVIVVLLGIASLVGRAAAEVVPRSLEEKVADSDFIAVGEVFATAPSRMVLIHTYTHPDGTERDLTTAIEVLKLEVSKVLKGDRRRVNKVKVPFVYLAIAEERAFGDSTRPTARVGEKGIWLMKHDSILTGLLFLNSPVIARDKQRQIEALIKKLGVTTAGRAKASSPPVFILGREKVRPHQAAR